MAAARVVDGDLREAEADLLVDRVERREVEQRREVDEGPALLEEPSDPHARMVA